MDAGRLPCYLWNMTSIKGLSQMKRGPLVLAVVVVFLIMGLMSLPAAVRLAADWYWFSSLGYQSVFLTTLSTKVLLGVGAALFAFGFFYVNLRFAQRGVVPDPVVVNINAKTPKVDITRLLRLLA